MFAGAPPRMLNSVFIALPRNAKSGNHEYFCLLGGRPVRDVIETQRHGVTETTETGL
jgi:hypothetical protein